MNTTTAVVPIENPQGNMQKALAMVEYIIRRRNEVLAEIERAEGAIDEVNYNSAESKAELARLGDIVEDLRDKGKQLVRAVVEATEAKRVLTAIDARLWNYSTKADPDCAYAKVSAAYKALADRVKGYAKANKPAVPVRARVILLYATDKGMADLAGKIRAEKVPGVVGYLFPADEAQERKIVKMIEPKEEAK